MSLSVCDLPLENPAPLRTLSEWLKIAVEKSDYESAYACCLSSVSADGRPRGRMVLAKEVLDDRYITFHTNRQTSQKSSDFSSTSFAAMTFYWPLFARQIRLEGRISAADPEISERYWRKRDWRAQTATMASKQSEVAAGWGEIRSAREEVRERYAELEDRPEENLPLPAHWGAYQIDVDRIEFWESGGISREHHRLRYTREERDGGFEWSAEILYP